MDQELIEVFAKIEKRLAEVERVYCRYQGPRGEKGAPAKVSVGKVEVGDAPSVKVQQLDGNIYALDFVLPVGPGGRDGCDGVDGFNNIPGPSGHNGADAVTTISLGQVVSGRDAPASLRYESDVVVLDIVLPRGAEGLRGPQGEKGLQGERGPSPATEKRLAG